MVEYEPVVAINEEEEEQLKQLLDEEIANHERLSSPHYRKEPARTKRKRTYLKQRKNEDLSKILSEKAMKCQREANNHKSSKSKSKRLSHEAHVMTCKALKISRSK